MVETGKHSLWRKKNILYISVNTQICTIFEYLKGGEMLALNCTGLNVRKYIFRDIVMHTAQTRKFMWTFSPSYSSHHLSSYYFASVYRSICNALSMDDTIHGGHGVVEMPVEVLETYKM